MYPRSSAAEGQRRAGAGHAMAVAPAVAGRGPLQSRPTTTGRKGVAGARKGQENGPQKGWCRGATMGQVCFTVNSPSRTCPAPFSMLSVQCARSHSLSPLVRVFNGCGHGQGPFLPSPLYQVSCRLAGCRVPGGGGGGWNRASHRGGFQACVSFPARHWSQILCCPVPKLSGLGQPP